MIKKIEKKLLTPPFECNENGIIMDGKGDVVMVYGDRMLEGWITAALNEKYERDFGEAMRWIGTPTDNGIGIFLECPKCNTGYDEFEEPCLYCPNCGQRLDLPEESE